MDGPNPLDRLPTEARTIVERLGLQPHPEGGWFAETLRDTDDDGPDSAVRSTAIHYLLAAGERSHWHRVHNAVEVWHHYAGDPLRLSLSADGELVDEHTLGPDIATGQAPQVIVPKGCWQAAEPLGEWTLAGCTVAPGFEFDAFELAPPGWRPGPNPA